jgi:hypothetical protein
MKLNEDIHNYYERLVLEEMEKQKLKQVYNNETMADLCCTALNQLPSRYIRFDVDMAFYATQNEHLEMNQQVLDAVAFAKGAVSKRGKTTVE